jgi:4-amino-4-deoxy-L-arabinose transferase-like glycosyltransferase
MRWPMLLCGILLLFIAAEISGHALNLTFLYGLSPHIQIVLFCAGIALVVRGLSISAPVSRQLSGINVSLLLILLLAFGLRLWQLDGAVHYWIDELQFATAADEVYHGETNRLLQPFNHVAPRIFVYLQADSISLLGHRLAGLRLPSAIFGTLTVGALYLLARTLFDRRTALAAALLLATFPPHIHFSRIGVPNIADPLFGTLALAFLARGMRSASRRDYALAGAMLGLTQYFYEGGRLFYPPLVIGWLIIAAITMLPRPKWHGLSAFFAAAVIAAAPVYYAITTSAEAFAPRFTSQQFIGDDWLKLALSPPDSEITRRFTSRIADSFLFYFQIADKSLFYGGETALLLTALVPAFFLGLLWALWHWRSGGSLLIFWLLATSMGNLLLRDSALSTRYVVAYPALMLVAALGICCTLGWLSQLLGQMTSVSPRLVKRGVVLLAVTLVMSLAAVQTGYYFGPHLDFYNRQLRFYGRDGQDALFRAVRLPADTQVHIVGPVGLYEFDAATITRFLGRTDLVVILWNNSFDTQQIARLRADQNHAFFLPPDDLTTLANLHARFTLAGPFTTPYTTVPADRRFVLYTALRNSPHS